MSSLARRLVFGSVTYARWANGGHIHRIDGYSILAETSRPGEVFRSVPFRVSGRKWQLLLYPNGIDANHQGFVSANLGLVADWPCSDEVIATYSVSILGVAGNPAHSCTVGTWRRFRGICSNTEQPTMTTGIYKVVAAEELRRSAQFLLRNDCLNVQCDVSMLQRKSTRRNKWFML